MHLGRKLCGIDEDMSGRETDLVGFGHQEVEGGLAVGLCRGLCARLCIGLQDRAEFVAQLVEGLAELFAAGGDGEVGIQPANERGA